MAITSNSYTGNGSTTLYSFTFPYLDESHVKVTLAGALTTAYTFANATTIQFNTAPGAGVAIRIYRETNNDQTEATFFAGSSIKAQDLNNNFTQTLYTVQEVVDRYLSKVGDTMQGILNMGGFKITNLGAPTLGTDATTKTYVDTQDALKVNKAGDTMSGNLAMGGNKVTGLGSPSGSADAATKSYVDGYINTTYLGPSATDPTTRPGGAPLQVGDQYFNTNQNILKAWTGTVWVISAAAGSIVRWRKTASAGNTTLSGVDDLGITLSYVVGNEQVYLNGALQTRGVDYTAATGTSITFTPALLAGDVVELHAVQGYVSATITPGSINDALVAPAAGIQATKLAFTQSGTGATARTVDSKLKDVVSVKDFGAVGDGVTNDSTAIQSAVAASNGKVLFFPAGTYLITAKQTFTGITNTTICGVGFNSVIKTNSAIDAWEFSATCSNLVIKDLAFLGASVGTEGKAALAIYSPLTTVENCYFEDFNQGAVIKNENADDCTITGCTFKDIVGGTSGNGYATYTIGKRTIIHGNHFINVGRHDVYLSGSTPQGAQYCVVSGNTSINSGKDPIALYALPYQGPVKGCTIQSNTIKTATGIGISLGQQVTDCVIAGNCIENCSYGIYLEGSTTANTYPLRNIISNNTVVDSSIRQINAINSIGNVFVGNSVAAVSVTPSSSIGIAVSFAGSPSTFPTGNIVNGTVSSGLTIPVLIDSSSGVFCGILTRQDQTYWVTATNNDTSPSVANIKHLVLNNSSATSIVNFVNGEEGQEITLYFTNSNTTITQSNAYLAGSVNFAGTSADTLTLVKRGIYWFEKCRSVN